MTFLESIFERLQQAGVSPVLREIRHGKLNSVSGDELLSMVQEARNFLIARGMKKGDRCALLASNSIRWVALDLAMMAEEVIVVPLYSRQAPAELVAMMKDSSPARLRNPRRRNFTKIWILSRSFTPREHPASRKELC